MFAAVIYQHKRATAVSSTSLCWYIASLKVLKLSVHFSDDCVFTLSQKDHQNQTQMKVSTSGPVL